MTDTIEIINTFPTDPALPIVFIVYNKDMVPAIENMIIDIHGKEYFEEYVRVVAGANNFSFDGPSAIYLDPNFYRYQNNGYN